MVQSFCEKIVFLDHASSFHPIKRSDSNRLIYFNIVRATFESSELSENVDLLVADGVTYSAM